MDETDRGGEITAKEIAAQNEGAQQTVDWAVQFQKQSDNEEQPTPRSISITDSNKLIISMKEGWRLTNRQAGDLILWVDPGFIDAPVSGQRAHKVASDRYRQHKKDRKAASDRGRQRGTKRNAPATQSVSIASRASRRTTSSLEARLAISKDEEAIQRRAVEKQRKQLKVAEVEAFHLKQRLSNMSHKKNELKADVMKKNEEVRRLQMALSDTPTDRAKRVQKKGNPCLQIVFPLSIPYTSAVDTPPIHTYSLLIPCVCTVFFLPIHGLFTLVPRC